MSDSGESDEGKRLSDLDAIAEALRAGELDSDTRFGKRRAKQANSESVGRTPHEILTDVQARDDEDDQSDRRVTIEVELVLQLERDELVSENLREQLLQRFLPDLPTESIEIREITDLTPDREKIEVHMTVSIDGDAAVDELLSDSQSDGTPDARVKRVT